MKFMSVREFRLNTGKVRRNLGQDDEVVLTANGQPFAIVARIRPDMLDRELDAIRQARAKVALDRVRTSADKAGTSRMTLTEVDTVVRTVRREKGPE